MRTLAWYRRRAFGIGVATLAVSAVGAIFKPEPFFRSYLIAYQFWLSFALGSLGFLMIHRLTGGTWGLKIERILKASSSTFVPLALLFAPLFFGLESLYPWMRPEFVAHHDKLLHKGAYLSEGFFAARSLAYLASWILLSRGLLQAGRGAAGKASAAGLIVLALTSTFSAFDWSMSIEPLWASTIYGLIFLTGQGLSALALAVLALRLTETRLGWKHHLSEKTRIDLGSILLTLVILWAYLQFMQYLIIWSGNVPEETGWYFRRSRAGWEWIVLALALFQAALPIWALLFRAVKRKPARLAAVGACLICTRFLELYWLIAPAYASERLELLWPILLVWPGVGGLWLGAFLGALDRDPGAEVMIHG